MYILKNNKKQVYRHGEINFVLIDSLPEGLEISDSKCFATGSHNHSHVFDSGKWYPKNVDEYVIGYFEAKETNLIHPEHSPEKGMAVLPDGIYEVRKQNEDTPEGLKPVID